MPTSAQNYHDAQESVGSPNLLLMEFWEIGKSVVHRAVDNNEAIVSQGNTYEPANFEMQLPNSNNDIQNVSITISNISLVAGRAVMEAMLRIQCRLIIASGLNYDDWIFDTENMFVITKATIDQVAVSGDLTPRADVLMPYPFGKTGQSDFPGLYL